MFYLLQQDRFKSLRHPGFLLLKTTFQVIDWTICRKYGRNIITIFFKFLTFIIATILLSLLSSLLPLPSIFHFYYYYYYFSYNYSYNFIIIIIFATNLIYYHQISSYCYYYRFHVKTLPLGPLLSSCIISCVPHYLQSQVGCLGQGKEIQ